MSVIGKSVQVTQILGILLISSFCLYNSLFVNSERTASSKPKDLDNDGALTIVSTSEKSSSNDEDDGIVTIDENGEDGIDDSLEPFEPSEDWKTVKNGQKIPPGLHVQMDFKTGTKQARLMKDKAAKKTDKWDGGDKIGIINAERQRFTRDQLKAALKDFKYKDTFVENTEEHADAVKKKFRSYAELKKQMSDLKTAVKTEAEIVTALLSRLRQHGLTDGETSTILIDLEYYLHQIDNARLLKSDNGMVTVITLMNNSNAEIRALAAHALGAALQSNAEIQVTALDSGVVQQLLKMLSVDPSFPVRKKSLFALSTLLRQFPYAQKRFLNMGGLSALADLFTVSTDANIRLKIVTLLTDLVMEHEINTRNVDSEDIIQEQRTQQYKEVELGKTMSSTGWCVLVTSLLHNSSGHDGVEKVVAAMSALTNVCSEDFSPARSHLQNLLSKYKELAEEEKMQGQEDLFCSIHSSLQVLISKIHRDDL